MSAKFEYYGKTTENIISVPLFIVSGTTIDSIIGVQRINLAGEITATRPIVNEYGVTKEHLTFTYGLVKSDDTDFTDQEQIAVEAWLTSPRFSSELKFTDCDGNVYSYFGKFLSTEWTYGIVGMLLCQFTFEVNGSYAFTRHTVTCVNESEVDSGTSTQFTINVQSDEYEEYVYPIVKVTGRSRNSTASFELVNVTDNNRSMQATTQKSIVTFEFDCQRCMVREYMQGINQQVNLTIVKYKDLGWGDVGDIYWLRLKPGNNTLTLAGNVQLEISYYAPCKKVGGWLI